MPHVYADGPQVDADAAMYMAAPALCACRTYESSLATATLDKTDLGGGPMRVAIFRRARQSERLWRSFWPTSNGNRRPDRLLPATFCLFGPARQECLVLERQLPSVIKHRRLAGRRLNAPNAPPRSDRVDARPTLAG